MKLLREFRSAPELIDIAMGRVKPDLLRSGQHDVVLYHFSDSICSQKVRLALAEKHVAYTSRLINIAAHENLRPEYVRINPRAVVPTLVVDGQVVLDSAVIIRFIDAAFEGPPLRPAMPHEITEMETWIERGDWLPIRAITYREMSRNAGPIGEAMRSSLSARRALLASYRAENPDLAHIYDAKLADADEWEPAIEDDDSRRSDEAAVDDCLDELDARLAKHDWVAGPDFSVADLIWIPNIARLKLTGLGHLWEAGHRPGIGAYWERAKQRPSFATAIRAFNTRIA